MTVDKYVFWYMIQETVKKIDNLTEYNENIWAKNMDFKENLKENIKFYDNKLLENRRNRLKWVA